MSLDIVPRLRDYNTLVKNHTKWTHLFCIMIRTILGFYIITSPVISNTILYLLLAIVIMFSYKLFNTNTWKGYLKTVYAYGLAYKLIEYGYKDYAGLLLIFEALLSLQSRHIVTLINI